LRNVHYIKDHAMTATELRAIKLTQSRCSILKMETRQSMWAETPTGDVCHKSAYNHEESKNHLYAPQQKSR
jgi:hypothetical protein